VGGMYIWGCDADWTGGGAWLFSTPETGAPQLAQNLTSSVSFSPQDVQNLEFPIYLLQRQYPITMYKQISLTG